MMPSQHRPNKIYKYAQELSHQVSRSFLSVDLSAHPPNQYVKYQIVNLISNLRLDFFVVRNSKTNMIIKYLKEDLKTGVDHDKNKTRWGGLRSEI